MTLTKDSPKSEIIAEWVRRLRSGNYTQTQRVLRNKDSFCCLGVLCEVAVDAGVIPPAVSRPNHPSLFVYDGQDRTLPQSVADWAGVGKAGDYGPGIMESLASKNDYGYSFEEIANLIESNPQNLLKER